MRIGRVTISLPRPHKKHVGIRYVKMAILLFEEVKQNEEV